ncbi:MAG: FIST C-terminal domain-containing protein [Proteobacteria bacterium]|nr:FIST C-terminal domain-containing protein [Pseudomonadota bacterium]
MIQAAIGISDDIDIDVAIEEVLGQCQKQLGTSRPQVGILFSSCMEADFSEILGRILREFPKLQLIGCTTDGEISRETGFIEDSLALLLLSSDTLEFATAVATNISTNAEDSLGKAYRDACQTLHKEPACAFIFPDGLTTIGVALDEVFRHVFGDSFPVFGGSSGDHYLFTGCYQFHNDKIYSDAAPILLIAGDVQILSAIRTGPIPTGFHYNLGRHENNIVYEIDGKTAVAFFREHLGEYRQEFSEFPLAVYENNETAFYLRDPLGLNPEDGSISFVGTFPEHCTVRLTLVSQNDVLDAAEQANLSILNKESGIEPELLLIFPCTWVRHILGSKTNNKFALLRQAPGAIPFFGFYCYGEIAPFSIGTPSRFHNDTYVIVALSSRKS